MKLTQLLHARNAVYVRAYITRDETEFASMQKAFRKLTKKIKKLGG